MNESQAAGCTAGACSACGVLVLGSTRRTRVRPVGSRRATNARGREHLLHSNALLSCGPSHSALSHSAPLLPPPCSTPPRCTPVRPVGLRPVARSPCCTLLLARTTRWTPPRRSPARWTPPRCSGATRRTPTCVLRPTRWSAHPAHREVKSSAARTRSYLTQILTPIYLPLRYSGDVYQCFLARAMRSGGATRSSCWPTGCSSD